MAIKICHDAINPWQELQDYQNHALNPDVQFGATGIFIGTMRDMNDNAAVQRMTLEHYPGMTENQLAKIINDARERWAFLDALIVHRVGDVIPNDTIVLVAVWATHRGDACDACRFIVEALKSTAPFWKKEVLSTGQTRWVERNTDGYRKS
ncbi:MAG: molybdenum cofactor biosynthesis protein MoaE [Gammaproteobacteria bacterium]|nr:molybdenum cofactor biosynthesis protein MoaE [Gammaproteobacteria bacterium]